MLFYNYLKHKLDNVCFRESQYNKRNCSWLDLLSYSLYFMKEAVEKRF